MIENIVKVKLATDEELTIARDTANIVKSL